MRAPTKSAQSFPQWALQLRTPAKEQLTQSTNFANAKVNRTKAHDNAKESLQSIINDTNTNDDAKASAREKLIKLSENIKLEADCENLISAQTSTSCLVTIDFDSVEVVVPKGTINDTILIKIKDIILSKTDINGKNITIIELK
jgi:stage III sporulation protein AH